MNEQNEQKDSELEPIEPSVESSHETDTSNPDASTNANTAPSPAPEAETPPPSWQMERPNPEQQLSSWQGQQPYPGQSYPGQGQPPYPGQSYPGQGQPPYPGQANAPWQNQQPYPGQQNPQQPYPGQTPPTWQNQPFPNVPPSGSGNFYQNQNPNFQNPNMQNMPNQNMQGPNFQGQQGTGRPPANPMAVTSLILGIISLLVSCCCFPVGFIIGFVLAMIGLGLAISSKKGKPFSGYAIAGLILSILGICESLFLFLSYLITARMMQDPNISSLMNQIMEQYEKSLVPQMISSILRRLL